MGSPMLVMRKGIGLLAMTAAATLLAPELRSQGFDSAIRGGGLRAGQPRRRPCPRGDLPSGPQGTLDVAKTSRRDPYIRKMGPARKSSNRFVDPLPPHRPDLHASATSSATLPLAMGRVSLSVQH
jgi:hypothetical protein